MSSIIARSTFAQMISPAETLSCPDARARIFSDVVFLIGYPPIFKMPARYLTAGQAGVQSAKRQNGTYTSPSMIVRAVR